MALGFALAIRLSEEERDQLHLLIVAFIREDAAILQARPRFAEQTVAVAPSVLYTSKNRITRRPIPRHDSVVIVRQHLHLEIRLQ